MIRLINFMALAIALSGCINLGEMPPLPVAPVPPVKEQPLQLAKKAVPVTASSFCEPDAIIERMPRDMRIIVRKGIISADGSGKAYLRKVFAARKSQYKECAN